jgi:site-specific DNA recombinase
MKAVVYTRVSTTAQAEEGFSLDAQEKRSKAYAASQQWQVVAVFREEGYTGTRADRPALSELRSFISSTDVDRIIVFKMSRLGRSARDVLNLIHEFQELGVEVVFLDEGLDTSKSAHKLIITILAAVAEMEADNIREQVKAGMEEAAAGGRWQGGMPPWGTKASEDGFLVEEPDAASTIRLMADISLRSLYSGRG